MAEEQRRRFAQQDPGEAVHGRLVHLERVETDVMAVEQRTAQSALPVAANLGVAPNRCHALAQAPAAPLVAAQHAGPLELLGLLVHEHFDRHARRARGGLAPQRGVAVSRA